MLSRLVSHKESTEIVGSRVKDDPALLADGGLDALLRTSDEACAGLHIDRIVVQGWRLGTDAGHPGHPPGDRRMSPAQESREAAAGLSDPLAPTGPHDMNPGMTNRTPLTGPAVWRGDEIKNSKRWIRDLPASARGRARRRARRRQAEGPRLVADHAPGLSARLARRPAGRHRRRAGERRRHHEAARLPGGSLRRGRPAQDLLRPGHASRHAGVPEPQRRADARHPRRGRPCRPHLWRDQGPEGHDLPLLLRPHPDQRRAALPHRPHRRGGPAVRAPGARRRRQQACLDARHPQRDPRASGPTCSTRCSRTTGAAASARKAPEGREADRTAYPLPIFGVRDGKFTSHYSLTFIEAAQMAPDVPKLTDGAEGSDRRPDGDGRGALLRDDPGARRPAAHQQPRHLSRPHAVRGRRRERPRPPAAAALAHHAQQPAAARRVTKSCGAASRPASRAAAFSR